MQAIVMSTYACCRNGALIFLWEEVGGACNPSPRLPPAGSPSSSKHRRRSCSQLPLRTPAGYNSGRRNTPTTRLPELISFSASSCNVRGSCDEDAG